MDSVFRSPKDEEMLAPSLTEPDGATQGQDEEKGGWSPTSPLLEQWPTGRNSTDHPFKGIKSCSPRVRCFDTFDSDF